MDPVPAFTGDPHRLLEIWMQFENGDGTPGKVLSDLKREGMRDLLDALAAQAPAPEAE